MFETFLKSICSAWESGPCGDFRSHALLQVHTTHDPPSSDHIRILNKDEKFKKKEGNLSLILCSRVGHRRGSGSVRQACKDCSKTLVQVQKILLLRYQISIVLCELIDVTTVLTQQVPTFSNGL